MMDDGSFSYTATTKTTTGEGDNENTHLGNIHNKSWHIGSSVGMLLFCGNFLLLFAHTAERHHMMIIIFLTDFLTAPSSRTSLSVSI